MCYSALVKQDLDQLSRKFGAAPVRQQIDDYRSAHQRDVKRYPAPAARIFPGHYAPVVAAAEKKRKIELFRYNAFPPPSIKDPKAYTTYNARRDNLHSSFWSDAFMHHHGIVVLEAFYEWVAVKDLLSAGVVKLKDVQAEFAKFAEERKVRILAAGKKYKPTPTETKDARLRQIVIEFKPEDGSDLLVPVIFSYGPEPLVKGGSPDAGFAIVTDDPQSEIEAAGHDRCPVILTDAAASEWLEVAGKSAKDFDEILTQRQRATFRHKLAEGA